MKRILNSNFKFNAATILLSYSSTVSEWGFTLAQWKRSDARIEIDTE